MERHNYDNTNAGKRTRVMSESSSTRPKTRPRLVSESAASKDKRALHGGLFANKALHSHSAPSFSLLSPSSRQQRANKEERRCMLTASERKQKDIRDPEEELLRSVLVNNTMRHLNRDLRKEKAVKTAKRAKFGNKAISRAML